MCLPSGIISPQNRQRSALAISSPHNHESLIFPVIRSVEDFFQEFIPFLPELIHFLLKPVDSLAQYEDADSKYQDRNESDS